METEHAQEIEMLMDQIREFEQYKTKYQALQKVFEQFERDTKYKDKDYDLVK